MAYMGTESTGADLGPHFYNEIRRRDHPLDRPIYVERKNVFDHIVLELEELVVVRIPPEHHAGDWKQKSYTPEEYKRRVYGRWDRTYMGV